MLLQQAPGMSPEPFTPNCAVTPLMYKTKKVEIACVHITVDNPRYTILFSHANAVDIGQMADLLVRLATDLQCAVFAYDYPGYGLSPGRTLESGQYAAVRAALECLKTRFGVSAAAAAAAGVVCVCVCVAYSAHQRWRAALAGRMRVLVRVHRCVLAWHASLLRVLVAGPPLPKRAFTCWPRRCCYQPSSPIPPPPWCYSACSTPISQVPASRLILYGQSIGSAPTIDLAASLGAKLAKVSLTRQTFSTVWPLFSLCS